MLVIFRVYIIFNFTALKLAATAKFKQLGRITPGSGSDILEEDEEMSEISQLAADLEDVSLKGRKVSDFDHI